MATSRAHWKSHDYTIYLALVTLLALGWGVRASAEGRQTAFADPQGALRLKYPARWLPTAGAGSLLDIEDPLSGGLAPTRLVVSRAPRPKDQSLDQIAQTDVLARVRQLDLYRELSSNPKRVAGRQAVAVEYAFVADPHEAVLAAERVPVVVRGVEVIVPTDTVVYRLDFRAADAVFNSALPVFERILGGIVL